MHSLDRENDPLRVVIAGGGVAALEALLGLRALSPRRLEIVLVSDSEHFTYRPLEVGEPFGLGERRRYPLAALCRDLGARFVHDRVVSVHAGAHALQTAAGGPVAYDQLILAVGGRPYAAFEDAMTFDRETMPEDFDEVLASTGEGLADHVAIVVPDRVTWSLPAYELALLASAFRPHTRITLITHERGPLEAFGTTAASAVSELLTAAGIDIRCEARADVASATAMRLHGTWMTVDRIVALPSMTGPRMAGVPADEHGFVPVDEHSRVAGLEDVYAAGDGTTIPIKQGGLAAQQAEAAAAHIAARLGADVAPQPLHPVLRGLLRTANGPHFLRAELRDPHGTSAISREPLWWPPSKIASRRLAPYLARLDAEHAPGLAATDAA